VLSRQREHKWLVWPEGLEGGRWWRRQAAADNGATFSLVLILRRRRFVVLPLLLDRGPGGGWELYGPGGKGGGG